MGKPTGFLETHAPEAADASGGRAAARLARSLPAVRPSRAEGAGVALHGLRHSVLPSGLPARQPDSGLERSRLSRSLAARRSTGCTRRTTFPSSPDGCALRRARRRACSASTTSPVTIKATEVAIVDRAFAEGWVVAAAAGVAHGQDGGGRRLRTGRARGRGTIESRGPHASRSSSAPIASAACCATAFPSSSWRRVCSIAAWRCWRPKGLCSGPAATSASISRRTICAPTSTPSCSPAARRVPRDLPVPGRELSGVHFAMDYLTAQNRAARATSPLADEMHQRGGQARRHHRRRRHRRRLPGHCASAGRRCRPPVRAAAASARQPRGRQSLAAVAADLPRVDRARGRGRTALRRVHRSPLSATRPAA